LIHSLSRVTIRFEPLNYSRHYGRTERKNISRITPAVFLRLDVKRDPLLNVIWNSPCESYVSITQARARARSRSIFVAARSIIECNRLIGRVVSMKSASGALEYIDSRQGRRPTSRPLGNISLSVLMGRSPARIRINLYF